MEDQISHYKKELKKKKNTSKYYCVVITLINFPQCLLIRSLPPQHEVTSISNTEKNQKNTQIVPSLSSITLPYNCNLLIQR